MGNEGEAISGAGTGDYSYVGKTKLSLFYRMPHTKSIPDSLKTNAKGKKSLEDNTEKYFYELRIENNFLKHIHNTQTV